MPTLVRRRSLALIAAVIAGAAAASVAPDLLASSKDRNFLNSSAGIRFSTPVGWQLSTHTGHPAILALLLHRDGSRISVAVSRTPSRSVSEFAQLNRTALERQKFTIDKMGAGPKQTVEIEARDRSGQDRIRQLYLWRAVVGGRDRRAQGIVLTLTAANALMPQRTAALEQLFAALELLPPATQEAQTAKGGNGDGDRSVSDGEKQLVQP